MLHDNTLLLLASLASMFWFGFVSGKWWERTKNNPPPKDDDEMMW